MAQARMLHKKISVSLQVHQLSVEAKLLFTWMIAHTDDEGRMKGEPEYIKAIICPMELWTFDQIEMWLEEIKKVGLIYRWKNEEACYIEFPTFYSHQKLREDRKKPSEIPSYERYEYNQTNSKSNG